MRSLWMNSSGGMLLKASSKDFITSDNLSKLNFSGSFGVVVELASVVVASGVVVIFVVVVISVVVGVVTGVVGAGVSGVLHSPTHVVEQWPLYAHSRHTG